MVRSILLLAMLATAPGVALAQGGSSPGTPGPTAEPATTNRGQGGTSPMPSTPQTAPPVPALPPSGAPPDVITVPK